MVTVNYYRDTECRMFAGGEKYDYFGPCSNGTSAVITDEPSAAQMFESVKHTTTTFTSVEACQNCTTDNFDVQFWQTMGVCDQGSIFACDSTYYTQDRYKKLDCSGPSETYKYPYDNNCRSTNGYLCRCSS